MTAAVPSPPPNEDRQTVHIFLDESGTSVSDDFTLVGATAFHDVVNAEAVIKNEYDRVLGDGALWSDAERRRGFQSNGFHFTEDSESVRATLLRALGQLEFRAYAAYARNDGSRPIPDLLSTMYGTLLTSVLARYRDSNIVVVFEQNSSMDALYGKIWHVVTRTVRGIDTAVAMRGTKAAPCLAATDYVLGVTRVHLGGRSLDFQQKRFAALGRNYAYLIDFDDDRHLGGRKHPII